jgi:acetyl esterase/lipase
MEFDPLRDEGIDYASRMLQAGVSVELHSYPGTFHGSAMIPFADASRRNAQEVIASLKRRLHGKS